MIYLILTACIFIGDWLVKRWIRDGWEGSKVVSKFQGRVIFHKMENHGFALNVLQDKPEVVKRATAAAAAYGIFTWLRALVKPGDRLLKLSLSCIVGGGFNNVADRIRHGAVLDYISFRTPFKKLSELVFNISDFFIMFGGILYVISRIFKKKA